MGGLNASQVTDLLYDAVVDADLWPTAVQACADLLGGAGAALLSFHRPRGGLWMRVHPEARRIFETRFVNGNPFSAYADQARRQPGYTPAVTTDEQVLSRSALERTMYFNDFLSPYDGTSCLMLDMGVRSITGALNVCRTRRAGAFTDQDRRLAEAIHPHLRRAFWLSVKLGENDGLGAGLLGFLDNSPHGVLLLDGLGEILHANPAAERLLAARNGLLTRRRELCAEAGDRNGLLQRLIGQAISRDEAIREGGTVLIPRPPPAAPLTVVVTPLRAERAGLMQTQPAALVTITDPEAPIAVPEDQLRQMFGLSAGQARVAVKIAEGCDLKEAADALGVSFFTARSQLAHVFEKTGTHRQTELVRLILRSTASPH
jgi:DNA-binding CsgD family transcriptional regulator/PAS domain-containing protein